MNNPHGPVPDPERWNPPRISEPAPSLDVRPPPRELQPPPRPSGMKVRGGVTLELPFRAPAKLLEGMTGARVASDGWEARADGWTPPRGFLTMPGDGTVRTWRIVPPNGDQLLIAFERDQQQPEPYDVRGFLTGMTLRVYLATLAAAWDYKARDIATGSFPWEPTRFGVEYLGLPSLKNRRSPALRGGDMRDILSAARKLARIGVQRVDGTKAAAPEPLVNEWEREHDKRKALIHARLVWASLQGKGGNYVQVPRPMLRVANDDAPVALGLARFWRQNIVRCALAPNATGEHWTTLGVFLRDLDVDVTAGVRHDGRAFWTHALGRLTRAASVGELGVVRAMGGDPSANTPVVITPTTGLQTAYAPLARAVAARSLPPPNGG